MRGSIVNYDGTARAIAGAGNVNDVSRRLESQTEQGDGVKRDSICSGGLFNIPASKEKQCFSPKHFVIERDLFELAKPRSISSLWRSKGREDYWLFFICCCP